MINKTICFDYKLFFVMPINLKFNYMECWETFLSRIENDLNGRQLNA